MKEIGSEYWSVDLLKQNNNLEFLNIGKDYKLLMSGRTAIDYVLNEIKDNIKIVYMPNYCCESMIQPFIDNGYKIKYYDVNVIEKKYSIDLECKCSIFYGLSYFGYCMSCMDDYIRKFSERGILVIEDITHRFLSKNNYCSYSDYLVCSLRKWFPIISGGIAINIKDKFKSSLENYSVNEQLVNIRTQAMQLKKQYMSNENVNKDDFLMLYKKSNEIIREYKNMRIDEQSIHILEHININDIIKKRRKNAQIVHNMLKECNNIKLLYQIDKDDCPLFVPTIVKNRDSTRKKITEKNIYLPVHWPNVYNFKNEIYSLELSLICDQRYGEKDIIDYINNLIEIVDA